MGRFTALCTFLIFLILPSALYAAPRNELGAPDSRRMAAIRSLALPSLAGSMQTYFSPGTAATRVRHLQNLIGGEVDYYSSLFHIRFATIDMAVLDVNQWAPVVGGDPYGMPSVDGTNPYVFVMPASWEPVTWMPFPKRANVPALILEQALKGGRTWDEVKFDGCDGIGTHEVGHAIIHQLGIDAQTHWFDEFLASYVGYAYLKAKHPQEALATEIFWTQGLDAPHPLTRLADFERRYDELEQKHPANYGWYQLALDQRAIELFHRRGVAFLKAVRLEFAKGGPKLDTAELLKKLERLDPGWIAWSQRVETGTIKAVAMDRLRRRSDGH